MDNYDEDEYWSVINNRQSFDNYDEDEFDYLIHVHTGFKMGSGTKSKVFFRVNGDMAETGVRKMDDGFRQVCNYVRYVIMTGM